MAGQDVPKSCNSLWIVLLFFTTYAFAHFAIGFPYLYLVSGGSVEFATGGSLASLFLFSSAQLLIVLLCVAGLAFLVRPFSVMRPRTTSLLLLAALLWLGLKAAWVLSSPGTGFSYYYGGQGVVVGGHWTAYGLRLWFQSFAQEILILAGAFALLFWAIRMTGCRNSVPT